MKPNTQYECINDECRAIIFGVGKYMDGISCPRCGGPVIPFTYEPKNRHIPFDIHTDKNQLLTIELDLIDSVPKVFYQGEEITRKVKIKFEWETRTNKEKRCPTILIQHADSTLSDETVVLKTISYEDPFRNEPS